MVPKKKHNFSDNARMVVEPEKYTCKAWMIPLRGLFIEYELWNNKNGTIHILLCLQKKLQMVLFRMDKVSDKALWINQKDEGGGTLLNGPFIKPGLICAREVAMLD